MYNPIIKSFYFYVNIYIFYITQSEKLVISVCQYHYLRVLCFDGSDVTVGTSIVHGDIGTSVLNCSV